VTGAPWAVAAAVVATACASAPCDSYQARRTVRYSAPYVGHWIIARGDTMTLPEEPRLSDRFRLAAVTLDSERVVVGRNCLLSGRLVFSAPRAETLSVRWFGQPEQAIVQGWPADIGPFAGLAVALFGSDSLRGSVLFDQRMGVQVPSGVTAQFVAGRVSSAP
jgi:hypothetical protein